MQQIRYASPTFLFRREAPGNLPAILRSIAGCGFDGLELYGMFGYGSDDIREMCHETGLEIVCDHIHYDEFTAGAQRVIDSRLKLGARFLTIDNIPEDHLPGTNGFSAALREIERIGKLCRASGAQLLYHNHGYDIIRRVDGAPTLDMLLDATDPELLKFQPDLGWLRLGGADPALYLKKYRDRCPIVHFKDYYAARPLVLASPFVLGDRRGGEEHAFFEFRPSGYGVMNFPALMKDVLACRPEWITADHDMSYERDTFEDMARSARYVRDLVGIHGGGARD